NGTASAEKQTGTNQSEELKSKVQTLDPSEHAKFLNALDNYFGALGAITKAEDRAAFDSAADKASASIDALAQSVASASGKGAAAAPLYGAFAKASSSAIFWLVGQGLDRQRLDQLRISTSEAEKYIPTLADVIGDPILADQRRKRLDILDGLLALKIS